MKRAICTLTLFITINSVLLSQNQTINEPLIVQSTGDAIASFKTLDNTWLYTQWLNSSNQRKAYMGFNTDLTQFRLNLENGADRFTINGGNVGIGTYNPESKLTIHDSGLAGSYEFEIRTNHLRNTDRYFMRSAIYGSGSADETFHLRQDGQMFVDGNVGIGINNPNAPLHISSSSDGILTLQSTDNTWLYTQWLNSSNQRKAYMGFNTDLTQFRLNLENGADRFTINGGNVGIGTYNPGSWKLAVNGKIRAKEIKVETGWSDFVFFDDYQLPTLQEVENHIRKNGHLKDIPSAKEVQENGIFLGEMDSKLLQKIEELTLYTIQQEKKIKEQSSKLEKQEQEITELKSLNKKLLELQSRLEKLESEK